MATTEKRANPSTEQESAAPESHAAVEFGREVCGSLEIAEQREWLVTNGIGGYASGTVSGDVTRCYHGVLVAALHPPVGRTQLVAKLEETVGYDGSEFALATNRWLSGAVEPQGYLNIESFRLEGSIPVWRFALADALLEKRIWMQQGENTTYVQYSLLRGNGPFRLAVKALVNYRDFHSRTHAGDWLMRVESVGHGIRITAFDGATPFCLLSATARFEPRHDWYRNFLLPQETARGLDDREDYLFAAAQFIVKRPLPAESEGRSVIAGYHWFGDWGRDTMIALPGLTLATRRPEIAREILFALARYVDGGMLPNNFPDAGGVPQYNTADAALWYFEAVRQYFEATQDAEGILKLYPVLTQITSAHLHGTRYHIHVDAADGLLYAGEEGVQLTWMDAKVGDWVVTPRIGKPVEINALWYNALKTMAKLAPVTGKSAEPFQKMAEVVRKNFTKFWNSGAHCCYDVIDDPRIGSDASFRPNQIFAVSLPESPLSREQQKAVVDICAGRLLTSHGLRSLAQGEPGYQGHYGGGPRERDGAYHQGTVLRWRTCAFTATAKRR